MRKFRNYHKIKNTVTINMFIVFFCIVILAVILFINYGKSNNENIYLLVNEKIDKIVYQFFSDLITDDVINDKSINNLLVVNKNTKGEILTVDYDLEKTYKILTDISNILKTGIMNLENGNIDVTVYDKYLNSGSNGLVMQIPLFLGSSNPFLNNLGPKIPIIINFNENLLTNIKTKVTEYGFNNALLEIYVTVEMQKTIITPLKKNNDKFHYDILIGALVVNGTVPNFYSGNLEVMSSVFDAKLSLNK